jgi:hypothetical protein
MAANANVGVMTNDMAFVEIGRMLVILVQEVLAGVVRALYESGSSKGS